MKILRKINQHFLEDEVTGEIAPIMDHIVFYGLVIGSLIGSIVMLIMTITL